MSTASTNLRGTPSYLCPAYRRSMNYTPASDVYSFGIVLFQVITGLTVSQVARRFLGAGGTSRKSSARMYEMKDKIMPGVAPECVVIELFSLAWDCTSENELARPSSKMLANRLSHCADSL